MRFSAHHAPLPPRRRFWLGVGLVFLLLAVPVAVFNLAMDPFDFRLTRHLNLIRENLIRKNDTLLWTVGELRRIPQIELDHVTLAVVGDSRTDTICRWPNSPRIFRLGHDHVLNLSVGGASFMESVKLLEAELPRLHNLRSLLFSVPVERVGGGDIDRAANAFRLANTPMLYALSLGTLGYSIDMARGQGEGRKNGWLPFDRPDIVPDHLADPGPDGLDIAGNIARGGKSRPLPKSEQIVAAGWKNTLRRIDADRLHQRVQDVIVPLVDRLSKRDVRVVFFFPPLHPAVYGGIEDQIAQLQGPYVAELSKLGPVENDSIALPDGVPPVFADSMHLQQDVAHALLASIYLRRFETQK